MPFSGLSNAGVNHTPLNPFLSWGSKLSLNRKGEHSDWQAADMQLFSALQQLFLEEPLAEPSLFHALSKKLPCGSKIYLGNSLPIREWDLGAVFANRSYQIEASRGVNGIDGQLATFLGFSSPEQDNWAILGDLTTLYDMAAPWIAKQLEGFNLNLVVVNNGGGAIFSRMFSHPVFQHAHHLSFKPFAEFWGWQYEKWEAVPQNLSESKGARLIELVPDAHETKRFWDKYNSLLI